MLHRVAIVKLLIEHVIVGDFRRPPMAVCLGGGTNNLQFVFTTGAIQTAAMP